LTPKAKLGSAFFAKVTWKSGLVVDRPLSHNIDLTAPELVKYIPQNYLETICSELKESTDLSGTIFDQELMDVIYSHVREADRLGRDSLPELISYLTNETEHRIRQVVEDLAELNGGIADLENQATPEYRQGLEAQHDQLIAEIKAHEEAKPQEVMQPAQDPATLAESAVLNLNLAQLGLRALELENKIAAQKELERNSAAKVVCADKLLSRIDNLARLWATFETDCNDDLCMLGLDLGKIVSLTIDLESIHAARKKAEETRIAAKMALDPAVEGSLAAQLAGIADETKERRDKLDEPNRRYQAYLETLKDWQTKHQSIMGTTENPKSINGLEARLHALGRLPAMISEHKARRADLTREIYEAKESLLAQYRQLYTPVQEFIDNHYLSKDQGGLQFRASIVIEGVVEGFLEMLDQGRKGSFQGRQEGRDRLQEIIAGAELGTADGAVSFAELLLAHLEHDMRDDGSKRVRVGDQLRQTVASRDVYNFLFGLSYLRPRFELRWQDKPLDQLSPGERGNLLLVFYLLIDKRDIPLIIDQPEENLDNQTIAKMLVPAIKEAKERRQIIIVTHNPNLAVVCDADQVIYSQLDKTEGNRVVYTSGAIENPVITQLIIDVLEGTKPAFDLRDAKYEVLERTG
jgi:hypothetical protein